MTSTARWLVRGLITVGADFANLAQPGEGGGLSIERPPPAWIAALARENPEQLAHWLPAHSLAKSRDLHLLTMATGVPLPAGKTELVVRGVYGAGKTQCIALLAAYFALRGHHVYYASRENTTITAMAAFVHRLLLRADDDDDANPVAIRLLSGPQSRTSASTPLDARDSDRNHSIWNARLVLAATGLHLAQFRHKHRPLAKAVDYAEIFIYDETQQEAALRDIAILGALPRKCLLLRLGDLQQTSGGTGPGRLAQEVRAVSDGSHWASARHVDLCYRKSCPSLCRHCSLMTSRRGLNLPPTKRVSPRSRRIDACAGTKAPHDWCIMLPLSQRVQPGVYTLMAMSRYRDALVRHDPPAAPCVYPHP